VGNIAIRVENLSKQYHMGQRLRYKALRDTLASAVKAPFLKLRSCISGPNGNSHCSKSESLFWALKDVSFEIKHGEAVGIIGKNGAGKSTLLKILSRITAPTRGLAEVHGRIGSLLEVGTGFHPELSGRENIFLNGAILGMSKREIFSKFDEIVDFAEIEKFIDTPVKHYSSGMYVRLAFAVAAHLEPEILLVDEVLAVGDAAFQKKCVGKMGEVARGGRTILFVSHNMGAVTQLCPRVLLIDGGAVGIDSEAENAIAAYLGLNETQSAFVSKTAAINSKEAFIIRAQVVHPSGSCLKFGDSLKIGVLCRASRDVTVALEVIIRDQYGNRVIFLPSGLRFDREFRLKEAEEREIFCLIPKLPLAEGEYFIDLSLAASGVLLFDHHEQCLKFTVISSDPCGTSKSFSQGTRQGCVHLDAIFIDY